MRSEICVGAYVRHTDSGRRGVVVELADSFLDEAVVLVEWVDPPDVGFGYQPAKEVEFSFKLKILSPLEQLAMQSNE